MAAAQTDMLPDASVMAAMNEINAARRIREAKLERAEAEKVLAVKRAEADAEAKHLSGIGTARMRQVRRPAVIEGYDVRLETCFPFASEPQQGQGSPRSPQSRMRMMCGRCGLCRGRCGLCKWRSAWCILLLHAARKPRRAPSHVTRLRGALSRPRA